MHTKGQAVDIVADAFNQTNVELKSSGGKRNHTGNKLLIRLM